MVSESFIKSLAVFCADIGSVKHSRFGWARRCDRELDRDFGRRDSIVYLVDAVASDLQRGIPVCCHDPACDTKNDENTVASPRQLATDFRECLGFECPLFVPISEDPTGLTAARGGKLDRAWSAGAGAACLATGLTETLWILEKLRQAFDTTPCVYLDWNQFCAAGKGLFIWAVFVTKNAKRISHKTDAEAAVEHFAAQLPDVPKGNAVHSSRVRSLTGAALIQSGGTDNTQLLEQSCIVLRPD